MIETPLKILCVMGTRPKAIKLGQVIQEVQRDAKEFESRMCVTGQYREMLDQVRQLIRDYTRPGSELSQVAAAVMQHLEPPCCR